MYEVGVVISRYYESLKWLEQLKCNIDVYVYDRLGDSPGMGVPNAVSWSKPKDPNDNLGGLDIPLCKKNGLNIKVLNIPDDPGFEASTYAHHCYNMYDDLNKYTVFLQGHPDMYKSNVIDILNNPDTIKHTTYYKESKAPQTSPALSRIIDGVIEVEPFADNLVTLYCNEDYQWSLYSNAYDEIPWLEFCKNMPGSHYKADGKWSPPDNWWFGAGNQFIASKAAIHKHDVSYYKRLQSFINTYMDPNGSNRPWWQQLNQGPNIMEGIWRFIF